MSLKLGLIGETLRMSIKYMISATYHGKTSKLIRKKKWISKSLVKKEVIENKKRLKYMFTHCDLMNILVLIWMDDDPFFIYEYNRV